MLKSILVFGLTRRPIVVLAVMVFLGAGIFAFTRLNIEAYPNPAPVILEITAQAPGLSAEEMEKYYTIPMEIALYPVPGVVNIRSTYCWQISKESPMFCNLPKEFAQRAKNRSAFSRHFLLAFNV